MCICYYRVRYNIYIVPDVYTGDDDINRFVLHI